MSVSSTYHRKKKKVGLKKNKATFLKNIHSAVFHTQAWDNLLINFPISFWKYFPLANKKKKHQNRTEKRTEVAKTLWSPVWNCLKSIFELRPWDSGFANKPDGKANSNLLVKQAGNRWTLTNLSAGALQLPMSPPAPAGPGGTGNSARSGTGGFSRRVQRVLAH